MEKFWYGRYKKKKKKKNYLIRQKKLLKQICEFFKIKVYQGPKLNIFNFYNFILLKFKICVIY